MDAKLRSWQRKGINEVRRAIRKAGRRVVHVIPTGAGKTNRN